MPPRSPLTPEQCLAQEIESFLDAPAAQKTAHSFGLEPCEAMTDIFLSLRTRLSPEIRDRKRWVWVNAGYLLRNYLRREKHARLIQTTEEEP